ncbi:membrane-bound metal-dependent hydrolase [Legionella wadsworthii]|uniref:Membrane-bound metal-dependent hydrolase n=1 Tax=Legionella wadsworthii TaxID=28088 RepID=A0A378LT10_9GAMM|nr:metal-dependent hydrolase [Legionella wadsworthii]STY29847.1 membrane-bound metal-dependent hydrolase [Legionella wadsworthii]
MDPVTHAFLGAATSQAILYQKDKRNAWLVGGIAAMAPDLDIFIRESGNPMLFFLYHRYFTHSLLFIPIGALIVSLFLLLFKRFRKNWQFTFLAALIGYATHGVLDACTTYGTVLFWPFSEIRVSWDVVSIVDPLVTIILCIGITSTLVFNKRQPVLISLLLVGLFMLFNTYQHHRAMEAVESKLTQMRLKTREVRVFPKLLSSTAWRGIGKAENNIYIIDAYTPLFKKYNSKFVNSYPSFSPSDLPASIKSSPTLMKDFAIFNWFTDYYLIIANRQPLVLVDGRFLLDSDATIGLWGIEFLPRQPHVRELDSVHLKS